MFNVEPHVDIFSVTGGDPGSDEGVRGVGTPCVRTHAPSPDPRPGWLDYPMAALALSLSQYCSGNLRKGTIQKKRPASDGWLAV